MSKKKSLRKRFRRRNKKKFMEMMRANRSRSKKEVKNKNRLINKNMLLDLR
jgi:hypothetical protein